MSIYIENENKNILQVSGLKNSVELKIDCQFGTISTVSFFLNGLKKVKCGQSVIIGNASDLKGLKISLNGSSGNPQGGKIRIVHTCYETGGNKLEYVFPDDYSGIPQFDETDREPSYKFFIKFI